jgi:hypothetical protein
MVFKFKYIIHHAWFALACFHLKRGKAVKVFWIFSDCNYPRGNDNVVGTRLSVLDCELNAEYLKHIW